MREAHVDHVVAEDVVRVELPARFDEGAKSYKARTEKLELVDPAKVVVHYHSVEFSELKPDTLYAYRVGSGDRWSEWIQFRTAKAEAAPFSFLYFGDAQNSILSFWSRIIFRVVSSSEVWESLRFNGRRYGLIAGVGSVERESLQFNTGRYG